MQVEAVVADPPEHVHPETGPVQAPLHFDESERSPSSQTSVPNSFPSPQIVEHTEGAGELRHVQPDSTVHVEEHPSPDCKSLSSQFSPARIFPSPQIGVHTLGVVGLPEVQV